MNKIKCQRCKAEDDSCITCGGFKVLLQKSECQKCHQVCWVHPGNHTVYEGKRWHTFDGLEMVGHLKGSNCAMCEELL